MTRLLLVTNVWNEEGRIPDLVEVIDRQTLKPALWFWIDDGSINGSYNEILKAKTNIPIKVFQMEPQKQRGNLDTIGFAYSQAHEHISSLDFDYMAIADVDNVFDPHYFEKMCAIMDRLPKIGTLSAQSSGDHKKRKRENPMGGGKIVRWAVVQSFDKYWDLAPDTFLNIKATAIGLLPVALQETFIDAPPANIFSSSGRFRYGRRQFYVSRPVILVLYQALRFLLNRDHASQYLRGFWQEWGRGTWRCVDPDVREYYSLNRRIRIFIINKFGKLTR